MNQFLRQVAQYYYKKGLKGKSFIFPNRRSMAFFRKYLSETVAAAFSAAPRQVRPETAPDMFTINDFFCKACGSTPADRVTLLLELYSCYRRLNEKAESLDEFIFWGDIILGDFNDIDKYLVDPAGIYANVADFKAMQDTFEYLSLRQRSAIESFVSHFSDMRGRLTVNIDSENPDVKARFLRIWNIMYDLYRDFGDSLREKGMAYEGMVYRGLAERDGAVRDVLESVFGTDRHYVFVGLNALNECERRLMRKMRDAGIADFCWDFSGEMIRDPRNKSSFFMSENVKEFPQAGEWDAGGVKPPVFRVISVPSSVGQVKQIPSVLEEIAAEYTCGDISKIGMDCAVVLPDETLLMPLLNTIPPEIDSVNVTMGYPMSASSFYAMMSSVSSLQLHLRKRSGEWGFYYKQVRSLLSNSVFRKAMGEEGEAVASRIKAGAKLYVPQSDFAGCEFMERVFSPVITDPKDISASQIDAMAAYQLDITAYAGRLLKDDPDLALESEFAKEYYRSVNRLRSIGLEVLPLTYIRILEQLIGTVSVPFKGEPLKGLQIMGPLETRALDFKNMILLSANEGIFPKRSVSSSFIPPELRKGFGLPTYEYQDAVWAYYFYRMITRAENVWIMYDSRSEGMKSGEESRYLKQLEYHFRQRLLRFAADARAKSVTLGDTVPKTAEDVETVKKRALSASSLQQYMECPVKFYYSVVKGLSAENDVAESMDAAMTGNVYHRVMQALYQGEEYMRPDNLPQTGVQPLSRITSAYVESWLKREADIKAKVRSLMMVELKDKEITGRNLVVEDVITRYVLKTLQRDRELIDGSGAGSFAVMGLERELYSRFGGFRFKGVIDRLDCFPDGPVRVVDYKTGKVLDEDLSLTDDDAENVAGRLFGDRPYKDKPKIAFQLFIYNMLLVNNSMAEKGSVAASVYSVSGLFREPPRTVTMGRVFYDTMENGLKDMLAEIEDISVPFRMTEDRGACGFCAFRGICGR